MLTKLKHRTATLAATALLLLVVFLLLFRVEYTGYDSNHIKFWHPSPPTTSNSDSLGSTVPNGAAEQAPPLQDGNATLLGEAERYVAAIMNPQNDFPERLSCPSLNADRYFNLKQQSTSSGPGSKSFFFALDLHQCRELLPRLLGSIVEAIRFLGPENCALSIVEGRSTDGTYEVLKTLRKVLEDLPLDYYFTSSDINPLKDGVDRIEALAELRNLALQPLIVHEAEFSQDTTVAFINDVEACPDDVLELIHQRSLQNADMTCSMDWAYVGRDPTFYDVWIARGMTGESFFRIPPDGSWDYAWNLFWNDPESRARLNAGKPFQVFSCWNGAVAFTAAPIVSGQIKFRAHYEGEGFQGEPKLFCKDMWAHGHGRIAVIPSVNLAYHNDQATKIKNLKGYVQRYTEREGDDVKIEWKDEPPELVKWMSGYDNQQMLPWDEGLPGRNRTG